MPTTFLGISGKTCGVLSQGLVMPVVVLLPFWYRRRAHQRPGWVYRIVVTAAIFGFVGLTFWGGWPEGADGNEVPIGEYLKEKSLMFVIFAIALAVFYLLIAQDAAPSAKCSIARRPPTMAIPRRKSWSHK